MGLPQGNGFDLSPVEKGDKVLIIGGGIGCASSYKRPKNCMLEICPRYSRYWSFANQSAVILEEEFRECSQLFITTDDGTYGQGYVSTIVERLTDDFAAVYSCGGVRYAQYVIGNFDHPHAYLSMRLGWLVAWVPAMPASFM